MKYASTDERLRELQDTLAVLIGSPDAAEAMSGMIVEKFTSKATAYQPDGVLDVEKALAQFRKSLAAYESDPERLRSIQARAAAAPRPEPEPEPVPVRTEPEAPAPKPARRRAPSALPDPGLTAVTDSGLPEVLGHVATAVWLCLLRHANGRDQRRVEAIGYSEISTGTGLSRKQVRAGIAVLRERSIVTRVQEGRTWAGEKLTAEYFVPFPTPTRIHKWLTRGELNEPDRA